MLKTAHALGATATEEGFADVLLIVIALLWAELADLTNAAEQGQQLKHNPLQEITIAATPLFPLLLIDQ